MGISALGIGYGQDSRDRRCMSTRLFTTWHTSSVDGLDHAVTDEEMATGLGKHAGRYAAVCGHELLATLMSSPPGARCPRCVAYVRARATLRDFDQRQQQQHSHRKPGLLARLLHGDSGRSEAAHG